MQIYFPHFQYLHRKINASLHCYCCFPLLSNTSSFKRYNIHFKVYFTRRLSNYVTLDKRRSKRSTSRLLQQVIFRVNKNGFFSPGGISNIEKKIVTTYKLRPISKYVIVKKSLKVESLWTKIIKF